jgi:hypothetical protein
MSARFVKAYLKRGDNAVHYKVPLSFVRLRRFKVTSNGESTRHSAYPRAPKAEALPDPRDQRPVLPDHYRHLVKGPTITALGAEDSAHLVSDLPAGLTPERPPAQ